jgi:hypothetical protein
MIKNFFEMPRWLKLLTIGGFAALVMALLKPFSGAGVFGEHIDSSIWWRSGAGIAFVLPALGMGLSAVWTRYACCRVGCDDCRCIHWRSFGAAES